MGEVRGKGEGGEGRGIGMEGGGSTALQQKAPQQVSPSTQKVLPQHVEPFGMQNGRRDVVAGRQHSSGDL